MTVVPFSRPPKGRIWPVAMAAVAVAAIGFAFVFWLSGWWERLVSSGPNVILPISVVDGDTVRYGGQVYRLVGFDTPEKGDLARCDDERRKAERATKRLKELAAASDAKLQRISCACKASQEGTKLCNYGRLCGKLTIDGRDVGQILIGEGLAHAYVCEGTRCPKRRPWC